MTFRNNQKYPEQLDVKWSCFAKQCKKRARSKKQMWGGSKNISIIKADSYGGLQTMAEAWEICRGTCNSHKGTDNKQFGAATQKAENRF